jgi:hypothetical protein
MSAKMEPAMSTVKVIDPQSNKILLETSIEEIEKAYAYAREMEEYGIDVIIDAPSSSETLISSLGANSEDISALKDGINAEIASHDGCCNKKETN